MSFIERIQSWLERILPEPTAFDPNLEKETEEGAESSLVKLYAQGNVDLRQGNYITSDIIEQEKSDILAHSFLPAK